VRRTVTRTCTRLRADGTECGNLTTNEDGWCRAQGCGGFRGDHERQVVEQFLIPDEWQSTYVPASASGIPLDPDEAYEIRVTKTAVIRFVGAHGGTDRAAETELRSFLEDALRQGKVRRGPGGRWVVFLAGFTCVLAPDCSAVISYSSLHAERSYSQIVAGVPSRISKRHHGSSLPQGYTAGERRRVSPLDGQVGLPEAELRHVSVEALKLTNRAVGELAPQGLAGRDDPSTLALLAPLLAADLATAPVSTTEHCHRVEGAAVVWLLSLDGTTLISAKAKAERAAPGDSAG
jgi:hypothetical protein